MYLNLNILTAQALSHWIDDEHRLSPAELVDEAATYRRLVDLCRPAPSEWMLALAAVLAIPAREGRPDG